jgi:hypothetical protein
MSTDYRLLKQIRARDMFDGRLGIFNIHEHIKPDGTTETERCLSDGRNYMWVYIGEDGFVAILSRYGCNAPQKILNAIATAFDTDIVSEYEPQYWGFDTQEEWDAALEEMASEHKEHFYIEILKYLRSEVNDIEPGTIRMIQAEIAEQLVAQDPELMLVQNKDRLLTAINESYEREHAVWVTLSDADMAAARMQITHEDDMTGPH